MNLLFYIKRTKLLRDGTAPIYLRITINKSKAELAINRSIDPKLWNKESGTVKGNSKQAKMINQYFDTLRLQLYDHLRDLREENKEITALKVKNSFLGIDEKPKTVLVVFQEHNDNVEKLVGINYSRDTFQRYKTSLMHTREFIKRKYKEKDLPLRDVDHEFLTNYETYFKVTRGCAQ